MPIEYTSINEDLLLAGIEGYSRSNNNNGRTPIYRLEKGTTIVRFLSDPWTKDQDGGWHIYREVSAFDGLRGGFELPNGLKEFPVNDQIVVTDPATGKATRQYLPRNSDPILELVVPSSMFPPADGRPKGSDKAVVNVLNEEGNHIILKINGPRAGDLLRTLNGFRDMDPTFSVTEYPWAITLSGTGASTTLTVKALKDHPSVELPEPHDLRVVIANVRQEVEDFVDSLRESSVESSVVSDDQESIDSFEQAIVEAESRRSVDYSSRSDISLKNLLKDANVVVPPRATRAQLISLAEAHIV